MAICVRESITISAPATEVSEVLCDFERWPSWSPWLLTDEVSLTFNELQGGLGAQYGWAGEASGKGEMTITDISPKRISYDLRVLEPFKSRSHVFFDVVENETSTEVTWGMDAHTPIPFFFLANRIHATVASDFRRGLQMLKSRIESGIVGSVVSAGHRHKFVGFSYVGLAGSGLVDDLPAAIATHLALLSKALDDAGVQAIGPPAVIYTEFDLTKLQVDWITVFPVGAEVKIPGLLAGVLPDSAAVKLTHKGSAKYLPNAWAAAVGLAQAKSWKLSPTIKGIEIYASDPVELDSLGLRSVIYLFLDS